MDAIQRGAGIEGLNVCGADGAQLAIRNHHGALATAGNLTELATLGVPQTSSEDRQHAPVMQRPAQNEPQRPHRMAGTAPIAAHRRNPLGGLGVGSRLGLHSLILSTLLLTRTGPRLFLAPQQIGPQCRGHTLLPSDALHLGRRLGFFGLIVHPQKHAVCFARVKRRSALAPPPHCG